MALAARELERHPKAERRRSGIRVRRLRVRVASRGMAIALFAVVPLSLVLAYVFLTAQLTAQTYRLHDAQARQAVLSQQEAELRDQVAQLESLPRLEAAAAKLHMTVPSKVVLVAPPAAVRPHGGLTTVAASIADLRRWFAVR